MASLTIRKLDETIKTYLRLRSARNGRSVEEEVRVILGELLQGRSESSATPSQAALPPAEVQARAAWHANTTDQPRVTLIIGGGIAPSKRLGLNPRLQERPTHVPCWM